MSECELPKYLNNYSPMQLPIILDDVPVKQVIAAAGSGKTRTLIGLVEHSLRTGRDKAGRIMLLSFSRKAAGEIKDRLPEELRDSVWVSTFHSFCFRHLTSLHPYYKENRPGIIEESEKRLWIKKFFRKHSHRVGGIPYDILLASDGVLKHYDPELYHEFHSQFNEYKKENKLLEYEDLIQILLTDLKNHEPYAITLKERFDHIIVDEFQDTDPAQLEFLQLMKSKRMCVVGDDYQAIYAFRGATVAPFLKFSKLFPDVKIYRLNENYRSLDAIVKLGNRVIKQSSRQLKKHVVAVRKERTKRETLYTYLNIEQSEKLVSMIQTNTNIKILCRSNYRVRFWMKLGMPEDSVLTVHKSKGLEFPVVLLDLIGGWGAGFKNIKDKQKQKETKDEEIRILYVGLSRAKNLLVVLRKDDAEPHEPESKLWNETLQGALLSIHWKELAAELQQEEIFRLKSG